MSHRVALLAAVSVLALAAAARADLDSYLKKPEPKFAWKLAGKTETGGDTVYDIDMTSQVWQDIPWTHKVQVYRPKGVEPNETMLIWNTGGNPSLTNAYFGMELARRIKAPVAFLYNIPNQPLFDGKKEDALIAETFVRTLEKKDFDWPLLFPMVKSVVKTMDALEAFTKDEFKPPVKRFVISGASKRGWTTWLTAASGDARVKAIAPVVIDTLNMQEQMAHQKEAFGTYSEMIHDYVERKLVPLPPGDDAKKLWKMVDPYAYRDRLTMPKLILNGANDPYWTADALNLYWDGLKGDKWVAYVPNAGHNVQQFKSFPPKKGETGDPTRAVSALSAFVRCQTNGGTMPKLAWKHDEAGGKLRLTVDASPSPAGARLWVNHAATQDFRKSEWKEEKAALEKGKVTGEVERPKEGYVVFFGEMDFEIDGVRCTLCTQVRVAGAKKE